MDEDDIILKPGNEPSDKTTRAMLAFIKTDYPELWDRLKARETDNNAREDEYIADPDAFIDSDAEVITEIRIHLAERFPLNALQLSVNISQLLDLAFEETQSASNNGGKP
jgi:hypothetical protein